MQNLSVNRQQGFTISELVVVFLLLAILAASALPRFFDVSTEAHDALFEATTGGFATGATLYRAAWTARGRPPANVPLQSFGGLRVAPGYAQGEATTAARGSPARFTSSEFTSRPLGYPVATVSGVDRNNIPLTSQHCTQVFSNLLQGGTPTVNASGDLGSLANLDTAARRTAITNAQNNTATRADFQAYTGTVAIDTGFANPSRRGNRVSGNRNFSDSTVTACVFVYSAEAENHDRAILYVPWTGRIAAYRTLEELATGAAYDGPECTNASAC